MYILKVCNRMYHQDLLMSIMLRHSGQNPNERPRPRAILNKNTHAISHNLNVFSFSYISLWTWLLASYNFTVEYERKSLITVYVIIAKHDTIAKFVIDHQCFVKKITEQHDFQHALINYYYLNMVIKIWDLNV